MASSFFTRYAQERADAVDWLKMSEGSRNIDVRYGGEVYFKSPTMIIPPKFKIEIEQYLIKEAISGSYNKQREQYLAAQHYMATDQGHSGEARESTKDLHKHH